MGIFILLSLNLVISYYIYQIRHLIIISALEKKSRENVGCSFCIERFHEKNKEKTKNANRKRSDCEKKIIDEREKKSKSKKKPREMPDQSYMTPNISYKFEKQLKRDGVFSQKNKNNPFFPPPPPLNRKKKKKKKKK